MTDTKTYTKVAVILHWLIGLIIIGLLALGLVMGEEDLWSKEVQGQLYGLHKAFGMTVIALTVVRILWRLMNPPPALPATMKPIELTISKLTHFAFYALMLGIPMTGWALTTAAGYAPINIFGIFSWPAMPILADHGTQKELAEQIGEIHELLAYGMMGLLALHIGAALKHQFIDKDGLLWRMIPVCKKCCGSCKTDKAD